MLFERPAADPDAVTRWRNRALRFVLPPAPNARDVVSKPATGKQSAGEVVRQCKNKQKFVVQPILIIHTQQHPVAAACIVQRSFSHELSLLKRVTLLLPSLRSMQTSGSEHGSHAIDMEWLCFLQGVLLYVSCS